VRRSPLRNVYLFLPSGAAADALRVLVRSATDAAERTAAVAMPDDAAAFRLRVLARLVTKATEQTAAVAH